MDEYHKPDAGIDDKENTTNNMHDDSANNIETIFAIARRFQLRKNTFQRPQTFFLANENVINGLKNSIRILQVFVILFINAYNSISPKYWLFLVK